MPQGRRAVSQSGHPFSGGFSGNRTANSIIPLGALPGISSRGTGVTIAGSGLLGPRTSTTTSTLFPGVSTSLNSSLLSAATRAPSLVSPVRGTSRSGSGWDFSYVASLPPLSAGNGVPAPNPTRTGFFQAAAPDRELPRSINVDARELARQRFVVSDPLFAANGSPRASAEILGGALAEPIDWLLTAREIYNDPASPFSYAGLLPGIPAAAGRLGKTAARAADDAAELAKTIEFVKTARAAEKAELAALGRLPQDVRVSPTPPVQKSLDRNISRSATQNARAQRDAQRLVAAGADNVRLNQHQVDKALQRVGVDRPDLQYTNPKTGQRVYIEYESPGSTRGAAHASRILSNDPNAKVIIRGNSP